MAFYTHKPFYVEVVEVTSDNISNVYTWVSSSEMFTVKDLTSSSFSMQFASETEVIVEVGNLIMRRGPKNFTVISQDTLQKMWDLVTPEQAALLPNKKELIDNSKTLESTWTPFS